LDELLLDEIQARESFLQCGGVLRIKKPLVNCIQVQILLPFHHGWIPPPLLPVRIHPNVLKAKWEEKVRTYTLEAETRKSCSTNLTCID
jgi:hypothetical protein